MTVAVEDVQVSAEFQDSAHGNGSPFTLSCTFTAPTGILVQFDTAGAVYTPGSVSGVTYGGLALTNVANAAAEDTAGEVGTVDWWALLSGAPAGTQDLVVTWGLDETALKRVVAYAVTSATGVIRVVAVAIAEENAANPSVTLDSGTDTAIVFLPLFSGQPVALVVPGASLTSDMAVAVAADVRSLHAAHETTATTGSRAVGWTALTDDRALSGIAVAETAAPFIGRRRPFQPQLAQ